MSATGQRGESPSADRPRGGYSVTVSPRALASPHAARCPRVCGQTGRPKRAMARRAWAARAPRGGTALKMATAGGLPAKASNCWVAGTVSRSRIWARHGMTTRLGNAGGFQHGRFRPRWRIDHHKVNALLSSRPEGVLQRATAERRSPLGRAPAAGPASGTRSPAGLHPTR